MIIGIVMVILLGGGCCSAVIVIAMTGSSSRTSSSISVSIASVWKDTLRREEVVGTNSSSNASLSLSESSSLVAMVRWVLNMDDAAWS